MKLNLLLLSAAAMVSAATATERVELNSAANYAILAEKGISTVPSSDITGDIAVYPITVAAITGFGLIMDSSGTFSRSHPQLKGDSKAFGPDYTSPTPSNLLQAVLDMQGAYNDAASRTVSLPPASYQDLKGGLIGGETLKAGVYKFGSNVLITDHVTFDAEDNADAVFIIQITGSVIQDAGKNVILQGGAQAQNIYWQVAGHVEVGAGAHMQGVLLIKTLVAMVTGSSLNGRILAQTAVTLDSTRIVEEKQTHV
jgi:hypothetical protein